MEANHFDISEQEKSAEREHIENLVLGGAQLPQILEIFPQYDRNCIVKIIESVARFCWLDKKEWQHYKLYGKPLSLKELKYNENGERITDLLQKSFSEFYLTKKFKETN